MSVLVSAAPLYLSIGTGLFSLYLYSTRSLRSLGSYLLTSLCLLVPFLLVFDSITALVILGVESPSPGLVHAEYLLQVAVRLSRQCRCPLLCAHRADSHLVNLLGVLTLHPNTLSLLLVRPAFEYKVQIWAVTFLATIAICCLSAPLSPSRSTHYTSSFHIRRHNIVLQRHPIHDFTRGRSGPNLYFWALPSSFHGQS